MRLRSTARSPFIARRIDRVERMIAMLEDPQWALPETERHRVLDGLAYVADLHDLVPDDVPALGLLDDAIMLELVLRDLQHELDAYDDIRRVPRRPKLPGLAAPCRARPCRAQDWLDSRREALHARMRERRERDLARHGGSFEIIKRILIRFDQEVHGRRSLLGRRLKTPVSFGGVASCFGVEGPAAAGIAPGSGPSSNSGPQRHDLRRCVNHTPFAAFSIP